MTLAPAGLDTICSFIRRAGALAIAASGFLRGATSATTSATIAADASAIAPYTRGARRVGLRGRAAGIASAVRRRSDTPSAVAMR